MARSKTIVGGGAQVVKPRERAKPPACVDGSCLMPGRGASKQSGVAAALASIRSRDVHLTQSSSAARGSTQVQFASLWGLANQHSASCTRGMQCACVCVAVCLAPGANRPTYESRFRCFWHTKGMPLAPAKLLLKSSAMTWRALSWNLRRGSGLARPGNQQASSALSGAGKTTRVNSKNSPTCEHCANGLQVSLSNNIPLQSHICSCILHFSLERSSI